MKLFALCIVLATFATTILGQELHCYVCDDCTKPTEQNVEYCGPSTAPTTEATTTAGSTESSPTDSTAGSTESSPTESSTPTAGPTAPPSTDSTTPPSTDSTAAATAPPSTDSTTPPSTDSTTPPSTDSTTPPSTDSTAAATAPPTGSTNEAPAAPAALIQGASNSRQSPSAAALLLRNYRAISRSRRAADDSYACYSVSIEDEAGAWHVKRGCVAISVSQSGCEAVKEQPGVDEGKFKDCTVCVKDRCNGSAAVQISMLALLTALMLKYLI